MELPEMDLFYLEEIEQLRIGLSQCGILGHPGTGEKRNGLVKAWEALQKAGKGWGWQIEPLGGGHQGEEDDESDEEGEYAPQVVET
jgi:hypothetical protein